MSNVLVPSGQGGGELAPLKGDLLSAVVHFPFQRVDPVMLYLLGYIFLLCGLSVCQCITSGAQAEGGFLMER